MLNPFEPILSRIPGLTLADLRRRVDAFAGRRLLVVGDLMLDEYLWGEVHRISPEAPVPVVEVRRHTYGLGGAANVVSNVRALGGEVMVVGIVGRDANGDILTGELERAGADTSGLMRDPGRPTTSKTRVVAHSQQNDQQIIRIDRESRGKIDGALAAELLRRTLSALPESDAVLVSDYNKGVWVPDLATPLLAACRRAGIPSLINPKPANIGSLSGAAVVSMNQHEAALCSLAVPASEWENGHPPELDSAGAVEAVGRKLQGRFGCRVLFVTQGARGLSVFDDEGSIHLPAIPAEVYDGTGAGDTVASVAAMTLAAGGTPLEAAALGDAGGAIKVHKLGAVAVSAQELRTLIVDGKVEIQGSG